MTFNLARDPWIAVDGARAVSVREALAGAHRIRVMGDYAPYALSELRLLLAVAYRAYSEEISRAASPAAWWRSVWEAGRLPEGPLDDYLGRWADRFDLFGPRAFMQAPGLVQESGGFSPVAALLARGSSGKAPFYDRRPALDDDGADPAEAAKMLLFTQAFDVGGIKTLPAGAHGRNGKQYAEKGSASLGWCGYQMSAVLVGSSLFETVMLNLPLEDSSGRPVYAVCGDLPPWELDPPGPLPSHRAPEGPVQALTWQSRRVRLVEDGGRAVGCVVSYGDLCRPLDRYGREPMASYYVSTAGELTGIVRVSERSEAWEHLRSVLGTHGAMSAAWAGRLVDARRSVSVRAVGLGYDKYASTVLFEADGEVSIGASALPGGECSATVRDALSRVARAMRIYARFCTDAERAQGDMRSAGSDEAADDAIDEARFAVDPIVRRMLASAAPGSCRETCLAHMAEIAGEITSMAEDRFRSRGMSYFSSHFGTSDGGRFDTAGYMLATLERTVRGTLGTLGEAAGDPVARADDSGDGGGKRGPGRRARRVAMTAPDGGEVEYGSVSEAARDLVDRGEGSPSGSVGSTAQSIRRALGSSDGGGIAYGRRWRYADGK